MKFILIIVISSIYNPAAVSIDHVVFESKEACSYAAGQVSQMDRLTTEIKTTCVTEGTKS